MLGENPELKMTFYAHTAKGCGRKRARRKRMGWAIHLRNVADRARDFARPLQLESDAELAGLLHDLGKYSGRLETGALRPREEVVYGIVMEPRLKTSNFRISSLA